MFETSQDILYLAAAISIIVFTFFLSWVLYYVVQISRQSNELITDFRARLEQFDASVGEIKTKVSDSMETLGNMSQQIKVLLGIVQKVTNRKSKR